MEASSVSSIAPSHTVVRAGTRNDPHVNGALRLGFRLLSFAAPARAAQLAERFWFMIPPPHIAEESRKFLATGAPFELSLEFSPIAGWRWGAPDAPAVLLMHGWGGYGAQFQGFVEPLTRAGFQVVVFDAPSHGLSGPSRRGPEQATLFDFADALLLVSRQLRDIAGVIAHSGGCAAAAWALRTAPPWTVRRLVFIAPFGSAARYIKLFQRMMGLSDGVMRRFRENAEREYGFRWDEFEVPAIAARVQTPPLLVIHDRHDRETSWQDGADIAAAWPNSTLETTTGLGHIRILRDGAVVESAVRFLLQGVPQPRQSM